MNYTIEQKISYAVRQRDDIALAAAVKHLPVWDCDYDEIRNVVESAGGGRFVGSHIRMGTTIIDNQNGQARVREETW